MSRQTRVPAIPAPTDSNLLDVAKAIKGLLDVREGLRGDELDSFVTRRDLTDQLLRDNLGLSGGGGGGGGGLIGPPGIPGGTTPPVLDLTPPPAPTGVAATAALTSITIQWDSLPSGYVGNHAFAEIWRSSDSLQGNAILIGTSLTRFFVDAVGTTGVGYHYWVRFVSRADIRGPFQGTEGAFAQTGLVGGVNLAPLLITADLLAAGALSGINLITNPGGEAGIDGWIADGASGGGGAFALDADTPGQGLQSFRLTKSAGGATVGAVSRAFQVIPGESYAIRLLARGAAAGRARIRVNHGPSEPAGDYMTAGLRAGFTDVTEAVDGGGTNTDVTATWSTIDVRYAVPAGQSWVSLAILADGAGAPDTLWFDNVSMGRAIRAAALEASTIAVGSAAIANGAIRRALIGDLAVDNAKIANLDAAKITTGFLDADRIEVGSLDARIANIDAAIIGTGTLNVARIADGSITVAKIFEIIFSNNWDGVYTPGGGGGPGGGSLDPEFGSTTMLVSFDGSNGSLDIIDRSFQPATLLPLGGAALSTAQARFGPSSLLLNGEAASRVTTNRQNALGARPFTIEAWVRPSRLDGDTNFANVVLLLHADGANGSTAFIDSSSFNRTVTAVGNAQISTTNPRFGTGSVLLDGAGDYLLIPASADFNFGAGDFTVECFVRLASLNTDSSVFLSNYESPSIGWTFYCTTSGVPAFNCSGDVADVTASAPLVIGAWTHVAVSRAGSTLRIFIDGEISGVTTTLESIASTVPLLVGSFPGFSSADLEGNLDEIRITAGVARYTAAFTPPTAPFFSPPPPPPPPAPSFVTDEWIVTDSTFDEFSTATGAPDTTGGSSAASFSPAYIYLRRATVTRGSGSEFAPVISRVVNTSTTPPTLSWTPLDAEDSPFIELVDAATGLWRLNSSQGSGMAFGPTGTLVIGGPGPGIRTTISRSPGFYPPVDWEYSWQN